MSSCPDLAQTVVVTCAILGVPFSLTGLESLRIKETDRIQALKNELEKFGYSLDDSKEGTLEFDGTQKNDIEAVEPIGIQTYDDHRMAMAFAPICCRRKMVRIMDPEVVSKSYPSFWDDIRQVGFRLP
jgi:3-phosphoshikimate 1-carboxyvinyltransferase